jgi:hypothetical protein
MCAALPHLSLQPELEHAVEDPWRRRPLPILSPTGLLHPGASSPTSTTAMVAFPWWIHRAPVFL